MLQAFLPQAAFPSTGRGRRGVGLTVGLAALLALAVGLLLARAMLPPVAEFETGQLIEMRGLESARGRLPGHTPSGGWAPVVLPDAWHQRWPGHEGRVWYRLRFAVPADWPADRDVGLLMTYLNMAGAVTLDGVPIWRDASLSEPLSRSWNQPRLWRLGRGGVGAAGPLGRGTEHTLLIEVAGHAEYLGGLGRVWLGDAGRLQALHAQEQWARLGLQQWSLGMNLAVGLLFLMLWVCWPREQLYGWYAAASMCWALFSCNLTARSPWPLRDTHQWQMAMALVALAFVVCFTKFAFRFAEARHPRIERGLAAVFVLAVALGVLVLAGLPQARGAMRLGLLLAAVAGFMAVAAYLVAHAWRVREPPAVALAVAVLLPCAAGLHDMAVVLQWLPGDRHYRVSASTLLMMSMALIMAWRLRRAFEREAFYSADLRQQVRAVQAELGAALRRQHELELAAVRHAERLNLVRDLHDGLGGSLASAIARLRVGRAEPRAPVVSQSLEVLQQIDDDLRLIIDSARAAADADFIALLAPARLRLQERMEQLGIETRWDMQGLEGLRLAGSRGLNVLRTLQEALTNVVKHSGARRVRVLLQQHGGVLGLVVEDDGAGFDLERAPGQGLGLGSLRERAHALGGTLHLQSRPGEGTRLALRMTLSPRERAAGLVSPPMDRPADPPTQWPA